MNTPLIISVLKGAGVVLLVLAGIYLASKYIFKPPKEVLEIAKELIPVYKERKKNGTINRNFRDYVKDTCQIYLEDHDIFVGDYSDILNDLTDAVMLHLEETA